MARFLGDINTRARGLRTHLLGRSDLERLAHASSLFALQRELSALGFTRPDAPATPAALEKAVRRHAARQIALLARWAQDRRRAVLAVLFEEEDRRSIQAILRGAAQGASPEARLGGLIPTTQLPERALQALAIQPTMADVVRMLVWWNHPLGAPLLSAAGGLHPSLFRVETELQRAFAGHALQHASEGGRHLRAYVGEVIDIMNAWAALLHFVERGPDIVELTFVEGGALLKRDAFEELMGLSNRSEIEARLARQFRNSPLSSAFKEHIGDLSKLEASILRAQIEWQNRAIRTDPGGPAPTIGFVLELRAQVLDLRRIIWGVSLRAPPALLHGELVVT